jgi:hypothetical protein
MNAVACIGGGARTFALGQLDKTPRVLTDQARIDADGCGSHGTAQFCSS